MQLVISDVPDGIPFKIKHLNLYDYMYMSSMSVSLLRTQKASKSLHLLIDRPKNDMVSSNTLCVNSVYNHLYFNV